MQELRFEQIGKVSGGIWANLGGAALGAAGAYFGASHGGASGLSSLGAAAAGALGGFFSPVTGARSFAQTLGISYGASMAGASFEKLLISMDHK